MNLNDLSTANAADIAALPVEVLSAMSEEYAAMQNRTKSIGAVLDMALQERYAQGLNGPGTFHRADGDYEIKIVASKRVSWDRDGLEMLCDNDELVEWIDWEPSVAESRYKAAPQSVRDALDPYRTVKAGKPSITFEKKDN